MGDGKPLFPEEEEGEEHLIAAAKQLAKALGSRKSLTCDAKKILADLSTQISCIVTDSEDTTEEVGEIEKQLKEVEDKVLAWEVDQSMIWDLGSQEASEYLNAADEARKLTEMLEKLSLDKDDEDYKLLRKAEDVLQRAMARLEVEFRHILSQNRQPFEHGNMSFHSAEDDILDGGSISSFRNDSVEDSLHRDSLSRSSEEVVVDLIHTDVIPELRSIANVMIKSNYDQECIQSYTNVRREALDDCLYSLEVERLSIEDVLKMEWGNLNSLIRKWVRAVKVIVRVYLASEKCLCDQIFGDFGPVSVTCFAGASKASVSQLLNFGEAMSIGPHTPEKLSRILDMYEVLTDLLPDINTLYSAEVGCPIRIVYEEVLEKLGESVRATFHEFKKAIASNTSPNAFVGGGIHPLTKYVMNYLLVLTDYSETLNLLLEIDDEDHVSSSPDMSPSNEEENSRPSSPLSHQFFLVASILERNLDDKSKLYRDTSLQHFFLMNNVHYMAQKVRASELRLLFGDEWIRKHNGKYQQLAIKYERASWSSILQFLRDEGLHTSGSSSVSQSLLRERLRCFYLAFEEIYKNQTAWVVPDHQLREELRISLSLKVIQAYRTFVGRHSCHISERYIRYTADDLEDYILDLFEGSPKSLQNNSRRSTA